MICRAAAIPFFTELFTVVEAWSDDGAEFWDSFRGEILPMLRDPGLSAALTAWRQLRSEPHFRERCDVSMQMGGEASDFAVILRVRDPATSQDEAVGLCTAIGRQVLRPLGYDYHLSRSPHDAAKYFLQVKTQPPSAV